MTGTDIVTAARTWIGTPWKHQGRSREGVDCAGLVLKVANELGLTEYDTRDYRRQATDETMMELCREHLIEIPIASARPGDVAVMRFGDNRHIGFLADYLHGGPSLVHAFARRLDRRRPPQVVEHRFCSEWLRDEGAALIGVFRFPGVEA